MRHGAAPGPAAGCRPEPGRPAGGTADRALRYACLQLRTPWGSRTLVRLSRPYLGPRQTRPPSADQPSRGGCQRSRSGSTRTPPGALPYAHSLTPPLAHGKFAGTSSSGVDAGGPGTGPLGIWGFRPDWLRLGRERGNPNRERREDSRHILMSGRCFPTPPTLSPSSPSALRIPHSTQSAHRILTLNPNVVGRVWGQATSSRRSGPRQSSCKRASLSLGRGPRLGPRWGHAFQLFPGEVRGSHRP